VAEEKEAEQQELAAQLQASSEQEDSQQASQAVAQPLAQPAASPLPDVQLSRWMPVSGQPIGWLDLGGSSVEIAFSPTPGTPVLSDAMPIQEFVERKERSELAAAPRLVYSHSYARAGQDEARPARTSLSHACSNLEKNLHLAAPSAGRRACGTRRASRGRA